MQAVILAVGSELLGTDRLDTNSLLLTDCLLRHGVRLRRKEALPDRQAEIAERIAVASREVDLVLISGGLGPTADDRTREALAAAFGLRLLESAEASQAIALRLARSGRELDTRQRRQAMIPEGGSWLPNPVGIAPGLRLERPGCTLFALPGVPGELRQLVASELEPWLRRHAPGEGRQRLRLHTACVRESEVENRIGPLYELMGEENVTVLAHPAAVQIHLWAQGDGDSRARQLDRGAELAEELLGEVVFGRDDDTLEAVVGERLVAAGATVATAESCTGGLVAQRLTATPGSSAYLVGGIVAYANEIKSGVLGVPQAEIQAHGAVSEPVARHMAHRACALFGASWGIGITGIAGPGGGTEEKPVGTIHVALSGPDGRQLHRRLALGGDRESMRQQTAQWALDLLRRELQ